MSLFFVLVEEFFLFFKKRRDLNYHVTLSRRKGKDFFGECVCGSSSSTAHVWSNVDRLLLLLNPKRKMM